MKKEQQRKHLTYLKTSSMSLSTIYNVLKIFWLASFIDFHYKQTCRVTTLEHLLKQFFIILLMLNCWTSCIRLSTSFKFSSLSILHNSMQLYQCFCSRLCMFFLFSSSYQSFSVAFCFQINIVIHAKIK